MIQHAPAQPAVIDFEVVRLRAGDFEIRPLYPHHATGPSMTLAPRIKNHRAEALAACASLVQQFLLAGHDHAELACPVCTTGVLHIHGDAAGGTRGKCTTAECLKWESPGS